MFPDSGTINKDTRKPDFKGPLRPSQQPDDGRGTVEDIIEIGRELIDVKDELPHGQFEIWIRDEFQMNREMANNFMQVATRFGGGMSDYLTFKPTVLYALAAPSTPDSVIEKAIEQAESGEKVTVADFTSQRVFAWGIG